MQIKKREFIKGTGGSPDYLVIARKGHYTIGLKPILAPQPSVVVLGGNIRVVWDDPEATLENKFMAKQKFPNFKFQNVDGTRASTAMGRGFPFSPTKNGNVWFDEVEQIINNKEKIMLVSGVIFKELQLSDATAEHSEKDIADFMSERFSRTVMKAKMKASGPKKMVTVDDVNKMISNIKPDPHKPA